MKKISIPDIKALFHAESVADDLLNELRKDERKGVKAIIKRYDAKMEEKQRLYKKYKEMCSYEYKNYQSGHRFIAGIDEAGRGPLAGPVVAAAVILPQDFVLLGLNDSKQLTKSTRESFFEIITKNAISYGIGIANNQEIDQFNIYQATKIAMYRAVDQLDPHPDHVLIDAVSLGQLPYPSEAFPKGDQKSVSIAAASVIAKVTRDRIMYKLHKEFPDYDFASNMGYGTKDHMSALKKVGVSPYHRMSFQPVKEAAQ